MSLSRRYFCFGSLALPGLAAKKPVGEKPNIVLILADGLPAWVLGCYGNKEVRTPNLDRLAQTGARFLDHMACTAAPGLGRATLLTGRTPMQLGDTDSLPAGEISLDKVLGDAGYACHTAEGRAADAFLNAQTAGKPFFLTVNFTSLRPPYEGVAQKYRDLYARAKFETFNPEPAAKNAQRDKEMLGDINTSLRKAAAAITALDDDVADVLAVLSRRKLLDGTLVVFTSTCGSLLGHHGLWDAGDASDPANLYEEVVATPLLWSWPARVPPQSVRPELVSAYDLMPSICELTAAPVPNRNLCGRSYLTLATGKRLPKKERWRTDVFGHYRNADMARAERYKLVLRGEGQGPNELYDLTVDPRERINQYDNQQFMTVRTPLAAALSGWKQRYSK